MKTKIQSISIGEIFPLGNLKGENHQSINGKKMRMMALGGYKPSKVEIQKILESHHEFLASGGAGGKWKALQISDIVIGFYDKEIECSGSQAIFERMNLEGLLFEFLEFPFTNFCGVFAEEVIFKKANLSHSLFTDASLAGAQFTDAYLRQVDFSRSDLHGACFRGANLSGADFENCNLDGADFRDAKINTARFPGARLQNVLY